jgi:hypothetical protein
MVVSPPVSTLERCDQSMFSMRCQVLLIRRSAVAAGPIQQVT